MKLYSAWGAFLLSSILIGASSGLAQNLFPNDGDHSPTAAHEQGTGGGHRDTG